MSGPLEPGRFFLPGPSEVDPTVLQAQAAPVTGHRGPEAQALVAEIDAGLRPLFGTAQSVLIGTHSATGFMEAAIRNGVVRRVLCVVNGAFSARFAEIAVDCGREVDVLEVPWGQAVDPADLARRLSDGRSDAVAIVHSETSTGVINPMAEVAGVVRGYPDVRLLVDSVSGVGGVAVATDGWDLDFVLTASQKALAMPPGLAFAVASPAVLERARSLPGRGYYFDLVRCAEQAQAGQTPTTPALTLLYAARHQLRRIEAETLAARIERHAALAARTHRWVDHLREERGVDVRVLAPAGARSPTVTCIRLPHGRSSAAVVAGVRARGFVIGGGYGRLKTDTIRIGHMGEHGLASLELALDAVEAELVGPG